MTILLLIILSIFIYFFLIIILRDKTSSIKVNINSINKPTFFPKNFLWGSATSSYQVEGYIKNNNWWEFEEKNNKNNIKSMHNFPQACMHRDKYKEDIQLMKEIGLNSYRFSLEWSRIEPEENFFDNEAIEHYSNVIDELIKNNIKPMITLHHFTNPLWFEKKGAFLNPDSTDIFLKYVNKVVNAYKDKVELWCTINEPSIYAVNGYFTGLYPPGLKDAKLTAKVYAKLLEIHSETYNLIKSVCPVSQVGLVINYIIFEPPHPLNLFDVVASRFFNESINNSQLEYLKSGKFKFFFPFIVNEQFISKNKDSFDFIGLNYYTRSFLKFRFNRKKMLEILITESKNGHSDMNWEIYPEGLYRALCFIKKYSNKPIYITENGIADYTDKKREAFIRDHIAVINKALEDGFDIKGYYYWSLLDNYEWGFGFDVKFGLIDVDFNTQERKIKHSSKIFRQITNDSNQLIN